MFLRRLENGKPPVLTLLLAGLAALVAAYCKPILAWLEDLGKEHLERAKRRWRRGEPQPVQTEVIVSEIRVGNDQL